MNAGGDFDWDVAAEAVVIPEQAATAVFENNQGQVVIRQAGQYGPDEDVWILIAPEHAQALADAIVRCAAEITATTRCPEFSCRHENRPNDSTGRAMTAAERKRKQRGKERDMSREVTFARDADRNSDRNGALAELPFLPSVDAAE